MGKQDQDEDQDQNEAQTLEGARVWTVRGFSPAHVTGFFCVGKQHIDPYRKGSRGAGLNLELGVTATVRIMDGKKGFQASVDGRVIDAPTLQMALMGVLGEDYPARVEVELESSLPPGQGFGLSGAGALAANVALSGLFGFPARRAMWEAHKAETLNQTGLGDVPAQYLGGAEIRVTPGPMPMGVTKRFAGLQARRSKVVCCVVGGPLSTKEVLSDEARMQRIDQAGATCVEELEAKPDLENYVRLSRRFAEQVGLMSPGLQAALEVADEYGWATQTMLGDSLHLVIDPKAEGAGDPMEAAEALRAHGDVWVTKIAARGAHVLEGEPGGM